MIAFRFITSGLAPLTLVGAVLAFFYPLPFLTLKQPLVVFEQTLFASLFQFMFA